MQITREKFKNALEVVESYITQLNSNNEDSSGPKSILIFDLASQREEFEHAVKGQQYYSAIFEIKNRMRQRTKYEEIDVSDPEERMIADIYEIINESGYSD